MLPILVVLKKLTYPPDQPDRQQTAVYAVQSYRQANSRCNDGSRLRTLHSSGEHWEIPKIRKVVP
jgi:hypothetical protein